MNKAERLRRLMLDLAIKRQGIRLNQDEQKLESKLAVGRERSRIRQKSVYSRQFAQQQKLARDIARETGRERAKRRLQGTAEQVVDSEQATVKSLKLIEALRREAVSGTNRLNVSSALNKLNREVDKINTKSQAKKVKERYNEFLKDLNTLDSYGIDLEIPQRVKNQLDTTGFNLSTAAKTATYQRPPPQRTVTGQLEVSPEEAYEKSYQEARRRQRKPGWMETTLKKMSSRPKPIPEPGYEEPVYIPPEEYLQEAPEEPAIPAEAAASSYGSGRGRRVLKLNKGKAPKGADINDILQNLII